MIDTIAQVIEITWHAMVQAAIGIGLSVAIMATYIH